MRFNKTGILPGFGLSLGFTLVYLSLLVLIPLSALVWKTASLSRKKMNMGNRKMKNWMINKLFKGWTKHRAALDFPEKNFNQLWQERNKD